MCYRMLDKRSGATKESSASRPAAGKTETAAASEADSARRPTGEKTYSGFMERVQRWAAARRQQEESTS